MAELGGYGGAECRIHVTNKILHEGEVNRARYMPQNPCLIATRTVQGDILVFDYTKHPSMPSANDTCHPELRLQGHKGEGYGLAWNKNKKGHLLSCDNNDIICIWDITQSNKENRNLSPLTSIVGQHGNAIEDVSWHGFHADLFASVGDDARILL